MTPYKVIYQTAFISRKTATIQDIKVDYAPISNMYLVKTSTLNAGCVTLEECARLVERLINQSRTGEKTA